MAYRVRAICGAFVVALLAGPAAAQPPTEDPFRDPIFQPSATPKAAAPKPPAKPPADADPFSDPIFTAGARDPFAPTPAQSAPGGCCIPVPNFKTWLTAEWVLGLTSGPSLVPVVTTGPVSAGPLAGVIGQPGTVSLFGGGRVLNDWRSGLRAELGYWFDPQHATGIEFRFYSLFSATEQFAAGGGGPVVVNVPQFIPVGPLTVQLPVPVNFPGVTTGNVQVDTRTTFLGGDLNLRHVLREVDHARVELITGYRQLYLGDEFDSSFTAATVGANPLIAPRLSGLDSLHTRNDFYGPQLGLRASAGWRRFTVEGIGTAAMGATVSHLDFTDSRAVSLGLANNPLATAQALTALGLPPTVALPLATAAASAGQPTLPLTNVKNTLTYFGVVAEGGVRVRYRVTDHIRIAAGYSFLYWNNVRRAQEMFAGGPALRPGAIDFTTHLFSAGLDFRY